MVAQSLTIAIFSLGSMKPSPRKKKTTHFDGKCEGDKGVCRNKCKQSETKIYSCEINKMCCVKSSSANPTSKIVEDIDSPKYVTVKSKHFY